MHVHQDGLILILVQVLSIPVWIYETWSHGEWNIMQKISSEYNRETKVYGTETNDLFFRIHPDDNLDRTRAAMLEASD
jgi:hypothetical protein